MTNLNYVGKFLRGNKLKLRTLAKMLSKWQSIQSFKISLNHPVGSHTMFQLVLPKP